MTFRNLLIITILSTLPVLVIGQSCGGADPAGSETDVPSYSSDSTVLDPAGEKEDAAATDEAQVRAFNTTVWMHKEIVAEQRNGIDTLVLYGRTSRDLTGGMAFVSDDQYGSFKKLSVRRFEVSWARSELSALAFGVNQFIRLDLKHSSGRPDTLFVRVVATPRFKGYSGSGLYLISDAVPFLRAGRTAERIKGYASEKIYELHVLIGNTTWVPFTLLDDTHFQADLTADQTLALLGTPTQIVFAPMFLAGPAEKRARLAMWLWKLDLTDQDPYQVYPAPACTTGLRSCLNALPKDTLDLAGCGRSRDVEACAVQIGVHADGSQITAAIAQANARIADPAGFGADAPALIGQDRLPTFIEQVEALAEERLQGMNGLWFIAPEALQAALTAETTAALDQAYATPLDFAPALKPIPGDLQRERDVGVDGLLAYFKTFDFVHSEFGRPLSEVVVAYRQWHVKDLRTLRTQVEPLAGVGGGTFDVFTGNWLSPYIEFWVTKSTGALDHVIFQID